MVVTCWRNRFSTRRLPSLGEKLLAVMTHMCLVAIGLPSSDTSGRFIDMPCEGTTPASVADLLRVGTRASSLWSMGFLSIMVHVFTEMVDRNTY